MYEILLWTGYRTGDFVICTAPRSTHLHSYTAAGAVVMHEDTQHVWDELRQVELEFSTQSHHNLLNQKDNGVLHGVVWCPVLLQL